MALRIWVMAVLCLGILAVACGNGDGDTKSIPATDATEVKQQNTTLATVTSVATKAPTGVKAPTTAAPAAATPTRVPEVATEADKLKDYCDNAWSKEMNDPRRASTNKEYRDRVLEVRLRNRDMLIKRYPSVISVGESFLRDEDGKRTDTVGITLTIQELVDQSTLPETDRLPTCIEGIPVQIRTMEVLNADEANLETPEFESEP